MERRSWIGTAFIWFLVLFASVAILAHGTPTGRRVLRETFPARH